ncbi:hypothetical protein LTS18_002687, partial [Coniosporium uncinatum]
MSDPISTNTLVRLHVLPPTSLPAHPLLTHLQQSTLLTPLLAFILQILTEASALITTSLPHHFAQKSASKPSPPSAASVELLAHSVPADKLPPETCAGSGREKGENWFARRSRHVNDAREGTASWAEMDGHLRVGHSLNEKAYTPDVFDARLVLDWDEEIRGVGGEGEGEGWQGWQEVSAGIWEMGHEMPAVLDNR